MVVFMTVAREYKMTVLVTLGVLAVIAILFLIVTWINDYSERAFDYEFFSWANLAITSIGYFLLFYGFKWFNEALSEGGDILNGQLLMGIGLLFILSVLYTNIKHTNFLFGIVVGVFQLILYIPLSVISIFALLATAAWLTETKPVYRL